MYPQNGKHFNIFPLAYNEEFNIVGNQALLKYFKYETDRPKTVALVGLQTFFGSGVT